MSRAQTVTVPSALDHDESVDASREHPVTTLAIEAYGRLRTEILHASLAPGQKLRIKQLSEKYGIGISPIREALNRLLSEGFVVQTAQKGFSVASFSLKELDELTRTKIWLNELGLRESIASGSAAWEEGVVLSFHWLTKTPRYLNSETLERNAAWDRAHSAFHASLTAACGSDWLKRFCRDLFDAFERYRALGRMSSPRPTHIEEHRAIMAAALDRDADAAVKLLKQHFELTAEHVRSSLLELGLHG